MPNIDPYEEYANNVPFDVSKIKADLDKIRAVLDDNGLTAVNYGAVSVVAAAIASGAVTAAKLADGAVTTAKLAAGAVTTTKIQDAAVTNTKLPAGGINGDRLETASLELGTGVDLSKAGPLKSIYLVINFAVAANTAVNKIHNLNTSNIIGFTVLNITFNVIDHLDGFNFHTLTVVDANTISIECTAVTTTNDLDILIRLDYR